jgi:CheY-like chemotaxis protein
MRILVIDDNGPLRRIAVKILSGAGFEVLEAPDGESGLRLWREHGADVLLTDLHIGVPSGIEVAQELRAAAPDLPVIIMSGSAAGDDNLLRAQQLLGSVGILEKPFRTADLLAAVAERAGTHPKDEAPPA